MVTMATPPSADGRSDGHPDGWSWGAWRSTRHAAELPELGVEVVDYQRRMLAEHKDIS
jgi:hypothetical protein